ncbi:MAG TPA: 16S rRNA (cytosine(967)-C(5))-methyltransferase RsmB [Burkholderiales bacterium]|nr:16S rRNA (cytosine(967)-C(5))-methyltransferase RsmB [Burkholderiales bacterium]
MKPARSVPSNARASAARVLEQVVVHGRYLDNALDAVRIDVASDGALVQELAYGTLRWFHQLAGIAALLLTKPLKPKDQDVHALLLAGLYQLRYLRVATHAAVDETVAATEALGKPWAKGLINACLREYLRRRADMAKLVDSDPALRLSHPAWLLEKFRDAWPEDWERIAQANNERPPLTLRVNLRRQTRNAYLEKLRAANIALQPVSILDTDTTLATPLPVSVLPGFAAGEVSVQDAAAQWATVLLDAQPGERVLDACAAPGGKTGHILERTPGLTELVALDREAVRVGLVEQNLKRLGLKARLITADASAPEGDWGGQPFDRILLDVPCSATGVIRRHPDIKLRRQPEDLPKLTATQAHLLAALWPLLRPGGKLLYVTCSILPEENENQMRAFLTGESSAIEVSLPTAVGRPRGVGRQILPGDDGMDGFYYACLLKK